MKRIAITGANGLVGRAVTKLLTEKGITCLPILRSAEAGESVPANAVVWRWDDPQAPVPANLSGVGAVIHLAGESITGRWTPARKQAIYNSRVQGTQSLAKSLLSLSQPPKTVFCASAIGYYGNRGDELMNEFSDSGDLFLSEVVRGWEAATQPLSDAGVRVVNGRFGIVLSSQGGALAAMLPVFQLGGGGNVGDGRQYWSWITRSDLARAILFCLEHPEISGPVNCVSPWPVTNQAFTRALGAALTRPTIVPLPAFAARLVLGQMADELLLASARVEPRRLSEARFHFEHTELEPALRQILRDKV